MRQSHLPAEQQLLYLLLHSCRGLAAQVLSKQWTTHDCQPLHTTHCQQPESTYTCTYTIVTIQFRIKKYHPLFWTPWDPKNKCSVLMQCSHYRGEFTHLKEQSGQTILITEVSLFQGLGKRRARSRSPSNTHVCIYSHNMISVSELTDNMYFVHYETVITNLVMSLPQEQRCTTDFICQILILCLLPRPFPFFTLLPPSSPSPPPPPPPPPLRGVQYKTSEQH